VMASTSDMMESPAKRPANSVLISRRSAPIKLPPWQRGLSDYLARRGQEEEAAPRKRSIESRRQPMLDWTGREREERAAEGEEIAPDDKGEHTEDAETGKDAA
jgi:hypothetical protein